jgi:hypothetical protein
MKNSAMRVEGMTAKSAESMKAKCRINDHKQTETDLALNQIPYPLSYEYIVFTKR